MDMKSKKKRQRDTEETFVLDTLLSSPFLSAYAYSSARADVSRRDSAHLCSYLDSLTPKQLCMQFAYSAYDPDTDDDESYPYDYEDAGIDGSADTCGYAYLSLLDDRDA